MQSEILIFNYFLRSLTYDKKNNMINTTMFKKIKNIMIAEKHAFFLWRNSLFPNASEKQRKKNQQSFLLLINYTEV